MCNRIISLFGKQHFIISILCLSLNFLFICGHLDAQFNTNSVEKKPLDVNALGKWPIIEQPEISNDGNFALYFISYENNPVRTLTIQSLKGLWEKKIEHVVYASFAQDNNHVFFLNNSDSLGILQLTLLEVKWIPNVKSFKLSLNADNEWMAYEKKNKTDELVIQCLKNNKEYHDDQVLYYSFSPNGQSILINKITSNNNGTESLELMSLQNGKTNNIYEGSNISDLSFDVSGKKIVFESFNKKNKPTLWYYLESNGKAVNLIKDSSLFWSSYFIPHQLLKFNSKGDHLLIQINELKNKELIDATKYSNLVLWNYQDRSLPTEKNSSQQLWASVNINDQSIVFLNTTKDELVQNTAFQNYLLFLKQPVSDGFYRKNEQQQLILTDIRNGEKIILSQSNEISEYSISPNGQFVIWFDADNLSWYSYEISSQQKRNISENISQLLYDATAVEIGRRNAAFGVGGWNDSGLVYLYDKYDIWQIDLKNNHPPKNVTGGQGRKHNIVLSIVNFGRGRLSILHKGEDIILSGYDATNKANGFSKIDNKFWPDLRKSYFSSHCYYIVRNGSIGHFEYPAGYAPIKAKKVNKYLLRRMDATHYPNLYATDDFFNYIQLSNINPEKVYNWMTVELINWKMFDGNVSQGILYKPENFDSTKKYPLIFTYYEKRSDQYLEYLQPELCLGRMDIPYMVSNGYLVFVPDIYYKPGHNGEGVLNSILSSVEYLSSFSWVDTSKFGLQGHSFGGWETNFLITHSRIFAAACEAAGVSDQVSGYNQLSFQSGKARQEFYELQSQGSPYGLGVTPWTCPDLYIANSPVFYITNVTTPLLMMHGNLDNAVPFAQAIEMFLSMKRAGKKVWLLQYKNADHILSGNDARDYTVRMKQFFDFYLKDASMPDWMKAQDSDERN